jgi:hypothetical protein
LTAPCRLRASLRIPDDDHVQLPIRVAAPLVVIDGDGAPKVVAIRADDNGTFAAGDPLTFFVDFTSEVAVVGDDGALALVLASGCEDDGCAVKEEQEFFCRADTGSFALTLGEGVVRNIDVRVDQEQLKYKLESIHGR